MANVTQRQILLDGMRNVVVKFTGVIDTADVTLAPALALSDLTQMYGRGTLQALQARKLQWSVGSDMRLILEWGATVAQQIAVLEGSGEICLDEGATPDVAAAGFDGSVRLRTAGWAAGVTGYTAVVNFNKLFA